MSIPTEPGDRGGLAQSSDRLLALKNQGFLVLLVLIWAASWPIIKIGVASTPPIWFGVLRYVIGTVCIFLLVFCRGELGLPPRSDWPLVVVSGALQMGAYAALTATALMTLPPGRASVLAFTTPIWVVPLAAFWLGERISFMSGIGILAGLLGVFVIAAPSMSLESRDHLWAYAMLMGASLAWALSILAVRAHRFTASALSLAPWQMLVAVLLLLPPALLVEGPVPSVDTSSLAALAFVGPISTGFAYWAVVEAGRYFRASTMSIALLPTPSLGILISALTLGEAVGPSLVAGVVLIALGVWLATYGSGRK